MPGEVRGHGGEIARRREGRPVRLVRSAVRPAGGPFGSGEIARRRGHASGRDRPPRRAIGEVVEGSGEIAVRSRGDAKGVR